MTETASSPFRTPGPRPPSREPPARLRTDGLLRVALRVDGVVTGLNGAGYLSAAPLLDDALVPGVARRNSHGAAVRPGASRGRLRAGARTGARDPGIRRSAADGATAPARRRPGAARTPHSAIGRPR
ncbi:hypothetical protein [Geodermatophilus obscurus]|uniref:hypothetical protein n=1 Tax=Geodermatophilus obscurus TaxID=1861 RepID=UPI001140BDA7|nr:hypothetical protein [Geodermatophilus obscurus]